jgi:hypothetical protein
MEYDPAKFHFLAGGVRHPRLESLPLRYPCRRLGGMSSESQVSFGVHPCTALQKGHREKVTLSGSLSISASSISTCVATSFFVFGHLNINCVNGTPASHKLAALFLTWPLTSQRNCCCYERDPDPISNGERHALGLRGYRRGAVRGAISHHPKTKRPLRSRL